MSKLNLPTFRQMAERYKADLELHQHQRKLVDRRLEEMTTELGTLRAINAELVAALEDISDRYRLPWTGTLGDYVVEIEKRADAALSRAKEQSK